MDSCLPSSAWSITNIIVIRRVSVGFALMDRETEFHVQSSLWYINVCREKSEIIILGFPSTSFMQSSPPYSLHRQIIFLVRHHLHHRHHYHVHYCHHRLHIENYQSSPFSHLLWLQDLHHHHHRQSSSSILGVITGHRVITEGGHLWSWGHLHLHCHHRVGSCIGLIIFKSHWMNIVFNGVIIIIIIVIDYLSSLISAPFEM